MVAAGGSEAWSWADISVSSFSSFKAEVSIPSADVLAVDEPTAGCILAAADWLAPGARLPDK